MRSSLFALALAFAVGAVAPSAHADDLSDCLDGLQRYQAYLPDLQHARAQCEAHYEGIRADPTLSEEQLEEQLQTKCPMKAAVCVDMRPEVGHAGCENYLQYGDGSDRAAAQQANSILGPVYDECEAQ